jgi:hypothetical protein
MKKTSVLLIGGAIVALSFILACGSANQFGGSFDIIRICGVDAGAARVCGNPPASLSIYSEDPVKLFMDLENRMKGNTATGTSGLTVRTTRLEIEYRAPNGASIPNRVEQLTVDIPPETSLEAGDAVPFYLASYEQAQYIKDHMGDFPGVPFQLSCKVTLFYQTTGGRSSSVERYVSLEVVH